MGTVDAATWQALGLVLTLLGLVASVVIWARRGAVSGLRGVAWSLLPLAAGLTGVLRLGWDITDSVLQWAARLVFSPVVWLGLVVAMVSLVLFVVTGALRRRTEPTKGPVTPGKRQPSLGRGSTRPATVSSADPAVGGMEDIEAILRKHGIQ